MEKDFGISATMQVITISSATNELFELAHYDLTEGIKQVLSKVNLIDNRLFIHVALEMVDTHKLTR